MLVLRKASSRSNGYCEIAGRRVWWVLTRLDHREDSVTKVTISKSNS